MNLQARTDALLALVADDRDARCHALLDEAQGRASASLAQARRQARTAVHDAFAQERARQAAALAAARAELQTLRRRHAQSRLQALLALGWARLPLALRARWQAPALRQAWVDRAYTLARRLLPTRPGIAWLLVHGDDWPEAERVQLAARVARDQGTPVQWQHDARIAAGLRIAAGGNVVDATLAGLLADREEVAARLVGLLQDAGEGRP